MTQTVALQVDAARAKASFEGRIMPAPEQAFNGPPIVLAGRGGPAGGKRIAL